MARSSAQKRLAERLAVPCALAIAFFLRRRLFRPIAPALWLFARKYVNWRGVEVIARIDRSLMVKCDTRDSLQCYLIYFGVWEPHITAFLKDRRGNGGGFIDIGANIGYHSLLAAKYGESVVAVEAAPDIFAMLKDNIQRNRLGNIRSLCVAVSDKRGHAKLYSASSSNIGGTTIFADRLPQAQDATVHVVPTLPLKDVLSPEEIKTARVIKIDVEGAEYPILRQLADSLVQFREDLEIIVELSPADLERHGSSAAEVIEAFAQRGYHAYQIRNDYRVADYLEHVKPAPPWRLAGVPDEQVDLVFSRIDAVAL